MISLTVPVRRHLPRRYPQYSSEGVMPGESGAVNHLGQVQPERATESYLSMLQNDILNFTPS